MNTKRTILIIDDSEHVRGRVEKALRDRDVADSFLVASNGMEGLAILAKHPVALVLCDVEMPEFDGRTFLRLKSSKPELRSVPVIMLTGKHDLKSKIQGLTAGASDYLTKPFDDEELVARAHVHIQLKELQDSLREANVRLEQLTRTDELTGLFNRRYLRELLAAEFAKVERYETPMSVVMLDIDHFKRVNDTLGHPAGDHVIRTVASTLKGQLRACDFAARYGGEEFVLVLPQTDVPGALVAAERCREAVENAAIVHEGRAVPVTVSLGVAGFPQSEASSFDALLELADQALYRSKGAGRNRVSAG